jgi:hypothetical protein
VTTGVLLWLAAAAAATAVAMTAVAAIGVDIFGPGQTPLSESEVDERLAGRTSEPPPSSTTPPSTRPDGKPVTTAGGTVIAACVPGGVRVLSSVPAQGFQVDPDDDTEEDHPSVKFTSGDREIEVRLRCVNGTVVPEIKEDDD